MYRIAPVSKEFKLSIFNKTWFKVLSDALIKGCALNRVLTTDNLYPII